MFNKDNIKRVVISVGTTVLTQTAVMALNAAVLTFVSRKVSNALNKTEAK